APAGDPGRAEDEHDRHYRPEDDEVRAAGDVQLEADDVHASLGGGQKRVQAADQKRSEDGAQEAADAPDDEHRERDERQIEIDLVGVDAAELVDEEAPREAADRPADREGAEALRMDPDADRLRDGRVLPRRAQQPTEAAELVDPGDGNRDQ